MILPFFNFLGIPFFVLLNFWSLGAAAHSIQAEEFQVLEISPDMPTTPMIWKKYGEPFDHFLGVTAYSNKPNGRGGKFQCTELIHRFISNVYGLPTRIGLGLGNANVLAKNLEGFFKNKTGVFKNSSNKVVLRYFENNRTLFPPTVGSIISLKAGQFGHIAIVRKIETLDKDSLRAFLFEQHGELKFYEGQIKPIRKLDFNRGKEKYWNNPRAIGWLVPLRSK
jgi:hypothetical protein